MTDPSDQLASPGLAKSVELGSTNGHLSSSYELPSTGDAHGTLDIEPSALPLGLTMEHKTMAARSRAAVETGIALRSEGVDIPRRLDGNLLTHPTPQDNRDFWIKVLADAPAMLDLPTDRPRPTQISTDLSIIPMLLDVPLTKSLRRLAMDHDMDLSVVVMAAWSAVLSRLSGQDDIIIGFHSDILSHSNDRCYEDRILPLRMDLSGEPNTTQLLGFTQKMLSSVMAHQDLSLSCVSDMVDPSKRTGVFQVAFQWQGQGERSSTSKKAPSSTVLVDLRLQLEELDNEVTGSIQFSSALFDPDTIKRHIGYLAAMLKSMADNSTRPVAAFDILDPAERRLVLETWNDTSEAYSDHLCFHQLFELQASKTPNTTAIVHEDEVLSYSELNSRANRLAHRLIELGVRLETLVALCVERSPGMIVGILAIMKAGGAYVPIDPNYASGRIKDILQDASPKIAVADSIGQSVLRGSSIIIADPNALPNNSITNPAVTELTSRNLAYIIYTSGSTGKPKGVMIEHRGMISLAQTNTEFYGIDQHSRILQFASCGFDASVWDIVLSLANGASLYLPPAIVRQDRKELWEYMKKNGITLAAPPPSFLQDGKDLPRYDIPLTLVLGGEALNQPLLQNLISRGCTVINDYGPTETTVTATTWRRPLDIMDSVIPIGRPIGNTRIYILDKYQQPLPSGAPGEMYISGDSIARGYLNRPELSAERFLKDPFAGDGEARMYRTGDLARYLPDGNIVFLGRNDDQIKIRGFRIEPGEIEARLSDHPFVEKAAVFAMGEGSTKRLVAYVVAKPQEKLVQALSSHLASCLPEYMVPAAIVRLDVLPLTTSGKIDRKALPDPDSNAFARKVYDEPRGEIETALAEIWGELLSLDRVSRNDDFFALGGHSLLVVRIIERLHHVGLSVSVSTIYGSPVLSDLAQAIKGHLPELIPSNLILPGTEILTPEMLPLIDLTQDDIDSIIEQTSGGLANVADIYSLSPLQDGILFHHLLETHGDPYLLSSQMAFESRELLDRYIQAFQKIVDRHDILRTAFVWRNISTPAQIVWRHAHLPVQELALDPADGPILKQLDDRFHPNHYRIDLTQAPALRFMISQDADGRWILYQLIHHLIGDHDAAEMMNHEVEQILSGQEHALSVPQPFRNTIAQARNSSSLDIHERFFKEMLGDIDEPTFPFGISEVDHNGDGITESHSIISQDLNNRLRAQAKDMGVSVASLCHVAWAQVLARTTGQERVVFGTVLFGGDQGSEQTMGLSINTLPFRCDIDSQSVRECVRLAHIRLASLLEHKYASLPLAQRCSGVSAGTPLFSSIMNYLHTSLPSTSSSGGSGMEFISHEEQVHFPGIEMLGGRERTNYPFALTVEDFGTALGLTVQTLELMNPTRVGGYMEQALESLVAALEIISDTAVSELEIVPPEERKLLIQGLDSLTMDYPRLQTIHGLFEEQVERTPDATALVFQDQSLTYAELNGRANRLAHHLIDRGVRPDARVAICVERSLAVVVGILAILKSGGAYVPLDPTHAADRLRDILADAAPGIVIADESGRAALGEEALSSLTVVDPNVAGVINMSSSNPRVPELTSSHLAYIIFTSGSTGKPKGVMVEHQGVVNLVTARPEAYGIGAPRQVIQFFTFAFDSSVLITFMTLCLGGGLHIIADDIRIDFGRLWSYLENQAITEALLTPAVLENCLEFPPLTRPMTLIIAGDALPPTLIRSLQTRIPKGRIVNDYGPTEATVSSVTWKCPEGFAGDVVPIGHPIANKRIYLLDKSRNPVPHGAIGEMYIGGVGIARGYLNRLDLTVASFFPDPFTNDKGARMYKTGDIARYLPNGNIVYLGRNDHQVKIRGFRIELGEIEARLVNHPLVEMATVIAMGDGSNKKLVAYVAATPNDQLVHILRSYLISCLPDYMVPAAFVRLNSLPLNSNGKIDRKALPVPDTEAFVRQTYEAPQDRTENAVAKIWEELLNIEHVGRNDNFFALGGHSLLAVRLIERLRRIGFTLTIRTLFKAPTLRALAQSLESHQDHGVPSNLITPHATAITPDLLPLINLSQSEIDLIAERVPGGVSNIQDIYGLSPLQEGILFHHLLETEGDPYLVTVSMEFDTREILDNYIDAIQKVVNRHDILRTAFMWENLSTPVQVVWRRALLSVTELQLDPNDGPIKYQLMQRFDPRQHRIDLSQAPLLRFIVAQDTDGRWIAVEMSHHLISDHSTLDAMNIEVKAFMDGQDHMLRPPQPFRNLIAQSRSSQRQDDHDKFFSEMLSDIDTPSLPFGLKDVHGQGNDVATSYQPLSQELNDRLRRQAKQLGVSVASLCHLAWAMVVSRTSGEDLVVFGTVLFGRMHSGPGADDAMGLFINTLPIRIDLTGSVREGLIQTHERLASLLEHEHASLVRAQQCSNVPQGTPLFSAMFNYRHNVSSDESFIAPGIEYLETHERTNYPFTLSVEDRGSSLGLIAEVVKSLNGDQVCGYMQQSLQSIVDALDSSPEKSIQHLEVLPETERQLQLQTWNSTQQDYPSNMCIHHLFERQVQRRGDAIALVFNDQRLTFTELNGRANRLAHRLIELGVRPDTPVAICVERSPAMIVAVLAILKAGGAYVPLDPTYPSDRLVGILEDADPLIVLADKTGRTTLSEAGVRDSRQKVMIDPNTAVDTQSSNPRVAELTSFNLAYIIYTSGSTGRPKGVMVEHYGVVNHLSHRLGDHSIDESSRVLQFTSLNFDVSVMELFSPLSSGGILYLPDNDTRLDISQLWNYIQEHSINVASLTSGVLQSSKTLPPLSTPLRLNLVGEPLPPSLLHTLYPLFPKGSKIVNEYGPTEATILAATWDCPIEFNGDNVPIGRPTANMKIYILDKNCHLVPQGAIGEMYIGGVGIARGYLKRPELTSQVFLRDPFVNDPNARMYKTGDMAQYLPDGKIACLGRNDNQVKIRGFRIELGEIEARLVGHSLVEMATVAIRGEGKNKKLVAYFTTTAANEDLTSTLRSYLMSCLPDYMVPAAIVRLDSLPLTSNGKIDRKALPEPDGDAFARQAYEAPQGEIEIAVAQIWSELLNMERVGRNDNFFALGGHSLLAVRLVNRIATLGAQISLSSIFASPDLSAFARCVNSRMEQGESSPSIITPISREGVLPLSFSQQRMWLLAQMEGVSETYHIPSAIRLRGEINREAFQRALDTIFARHEALRSVFVNVDGNPQVRLLKPDSGIPIRWEDLRGRQDSETELDRMSTSEANTPFDLEHGPLIRALMIQLDNDEHHFLLTQHHIVSDGWSVGVLQRELSTLYGAYCSGQSDPLPPLSIQYPDYAAWQKEMLVGSDIEAHASYWRTTLSDSPILLTLPTDRPRPQQQSFAGGVVPIMLDSDVTQKLRQLCKEHGVTLYMVILAAWSSVLSRLSGQDDIVIGSPVANRNHHQIEPLLGFFVNTLALRIDHSGDPSVRELVDRVRRTTLDSQAHQDIPFEQVVEIVQPPRSTSHPPLFQVMFTWENNEVSEWNLEGVAAVDLDPRYDIAKFDITLGLQESDDAITGTLGYSTALFDHSTMERHAGYLCRMIKETVTNLDRPVGSVELLGQEEHNLLLRTWNSTYQHYPDHLCTHHLFERQVERSPQATALVFDDKSMTYAELNERSNRLAHHLINLGVRPDTLVAICVERSFAMIVGILAILKAGGAYVPLDPSYASSRLRDIFMDASPSIVVADESGRTALGDESLAMVTIVDPNTVLDGKHDTTSQLGVHTQNPQIAGLTSGHLAYVIYTSGSTGKPKGVLIEHQGVVNLIHPRPRLFGIHSESRVLQFTSLSFDHSVSEIFSALTGGASLHLIRDGIRLDQRELWGYVSMKSITHISLTPSLLQDTKDIPVLLTPLTLIIMGEALLTSVVSQFFSAVPNARIINDYGPTEISVAAADWDCPREFNDDNAPIGRPIPNKTMYILDTRGQPVPLGAIGEIYIGGVGVARGYLNRPELTSQVFVADPFSDNNDARMYKTGDLGRYLPDGNVVYLGRNDHQVKIRGFRIELGEIETRLMDHPLVEMATVFAMGEGGDKKLVAYVAAMSDDGLVRTLRSYLISRLPDYMVPAAIVRLDSLPLTSNGKIDRKALPAPDGDAFARQAYEAPQGEIEIAVAQIWSELLNMERVGRNDNFFALGGHSLLAVRLVNRIATLGAQISLSSIFASPDLSAFARCVNSRMEQGESSPSIITPISREGVLPLSFSQQRMWLLAQMEGVSETYHIPSAIRLRGEINREAFQRALDTIFARHEALRSVFVNVDGNPQVRLLKPDSGIPILWEDLRGRQDSETELDRMSTSEANTPFDLEHGPLIRALMIRLDNDEHHFLLTQHHIVSDGWSVGVLQRELSTLYGAYCSGQSDPLPPLSIQYPDYAAWQKEMLVGSDIEAHTSYWRATLSDSPILLTLPTDRPRPQQQSFAGGVVPIMLDADVTQKLRQLCKEHGVTLYMVILAAWSSVLSRLSGQDDIVIGSPVANRNHHQIEPLLGFFVNTLALRIDHSGDPSVRELVDRVRRTTLDAQAHQDIPFEQVVEIAQPPRSTSHSPLFQVMFVWQGKESSEWSLPGTEAVELDSRYDIAKFDLTLGLYEMGDEVQGALSYSTALFDEVTVDRHVGYLCSILKAMAVDSENPITALELLAQDERSLLLRTWTSTQQEYPSHMCVHHLFEQQVERRGEGVAVVFDNQQLTYRELNEQANRLAHHLIGLGVHPDTLVAICVDRSLAMAIGILAILKAGGAYVPLDPTYTSDRLQDILKDADPRIVIADESGRAALGENVLSSRTVIDLNSEVMEGRKSILDYPACNPTVAGLTPHNLMYIIFTSGSTGKPKGVMVEHQGMVNLAMTHPLYGIDASSRVLQFFSFSFDSSALNIFMTLCRGGSLHLLSDAVRSDPAQIWNYLQSHSISHALFTPVVLQSCVDLPPLPALQTLAVAGEAFPASLIHAMQSLAPNGRIVNDYGPTEATVSSISWKRPPGFVGDTVPIGRPIGNKRVYLLNEHRCPVPLGAIGELYLGGVGVARGYLNRPELTDKVFLRDPFAEDPNARMYKTGDMARYLSDGNIVYLGRNDHQVKIRGFRIELGEIEARLVDHPLVDAATVIVMGQGSDKKLVAYVVSQPTDQLVHVLRSHLSSCLPDYMVPAATVRLDALPLTSNGKIDRKALPDPDGDAFARHVYEEPQGMIETTVAQIWSELLNVDKVSRNDNFFALGGHSLLAVRLMNRIATFGVHLPLSTLFASPHLSSFAECVSSRMDKGDSSTSIITPISREGVLPLSFSQQRMWLLAQMEGVSETYHIPSAIRLRGEINREALQRALDTIFARHEALRSVFVNADGQPQVRLLKPDSGIPIRWEDLRGRQDSETELDRMSTSEANTPFDLEHGPLIRALMIQLDNDEHHFLLTQHHIVSDGWSMGILQRELSTLYGAYCSGESDPLPPLSIQYPDYAAWQKEVLVGSDIEAHASYWRTTLFDSPILLTLPTDRPRPQQQSFAGGVVPIMLDSDVTQKLRQLCNEHGVTLYMVILAAWSSVLSRLSGQDDIVIGSPVANRNHHQIEPLLGFFVNTLALRIDHSGDPSVRELVDRARRTTLDAQAHQDIPFEQVVEIVQPPRSKGHSPLFQVMFAWENNEASAWSMAGLTSVESDLRYDMAKFDLTLGLYESDDAIAGNLGYSTALFDEATMERHAGYLCRVIQEMVTLDHSIGSVELLGQEEHNLLLKTWNATQREYSYHMCIHHVFEHQVERRGDATALVFNDQRLTYTELNERANRLAHRLIELGVQPETIVAICVDRSPALIIAVLAVLKAGGAYVSLDPTHPRDRLVGILEDAEPLVVLADDIGRTTLSEAGVQNSRQKVMINPNVAIDTQSSNPQVAGLTSSNLAYIIYTSGSTGKPKGVMIEHHGVVNYTASCLEIHSLDESSQVLQFASLSFDASVMEVFSPLFSGGTLHVLDNDTRCNIGQLWNYLQQHSITMAILTPALLYSPKTLSKLSTPLRLVLVGEAFPLSLVHALYPLLAEGSKIFNGYGPTEITVIATTWNCPIEFNGDNVPIGRPIANKKMYILDRNRRPVPLGVAGELYIGGVGVARGYLNRPELTSQVFLQDPFSDEPNARVYKTGDMARYLPDGKIVYLGRNDHQVKIRGFRIELGEIEARLLEHPLVESVTVVVSGEGSDKKLVAYVVAQPNDQLVHTLRSHLMSCLPDYMVPAAFVRLDDFPLNANGKIDRRRLPEPDSSSYASQLYEPPYGEMEVALATIWRGLLNIDKIGRHDNFFLLGGHSLMAVRMISQIKSLMGFRISLGVLFEAPTIAELVPRLLTGGNTQEDAFDVLLPIKPHGTRPPLFCIHHGFGLSWSYIGLARHLHADQPLYGLQARGFFNSNSQPAATVEDMALDYIDQIRRIQPHGPYHLLGYSFGCMVAHTMTAHLEQQGESVALLAAMDSIPKLHAQSYEEQQEDESEHVRFFANRLMDAIPETTKPLMDRIQQTSQHLVRIGTNHSPRSCNSGMILFRAMVQQDPTAQPVSADEWKPYVKGEIDVYDIDCDHIGMDQSGPLEEIGGVLAQKLEQIHTARV